MDINRRTAFKVSDVQRVLQFVCMGQCGQIAGRLRVWRLLACFCISQPLHAHALADRLVAEDLSLLVAGACKHGDVVRGAIQLHRDNIACAKCHRASADEVRMGPDLSRIQSETSAFQHQQTSVHENVT